MDKRGSNPPNEHEAEPDPKIDYRDPEWVSQRLGIDKNTVYKYLKDGSLPGLQLGRKWLISETRLAEFLEQEASRQTMRRQAGASEWGRTLRRLCRRFSEPAISILGEAREQALAMDHEYLGQEHLLLAMLTVPDTLAAIVLANLGVTCERASVLISDRVQAGRGPVSGELPLTPRARLAIDRAIDEANRMGHQSVGAEHLLLGLLAASDGVGHDVLRALGVTYDKARLQVARCVNPQVK
jgi:excisionase family DNA binding protein